MVGSFSGAEASTRSLRAQLAPCIRLLGAQKASQQIRLYAGRAVPLASGDRQISRCYSLFCKKNVYITTTIHRTFFCRPEDASFGGKRKM